MFRISFIGDVGICTQWALLDAVTRIAARLLHVTDAEATALAVWIAMAWASAVHKSVSDAYVHCYLLRVILSFEF
jgi:hypothetical protein